MAEASEAVMAVVHVTAPAHLDPHAIAAELTRAINGNAKRPMTAELSVARDVRTPPRRRDRYRHGFVALLSFGDQEPPDELDRRVRKIARKALRRRFGHKMAAEVRTELATAEIAAFWCSMRGTPRRPA